MSRLVTGMLALARADSGRKLVRSIVAVDNVVYDVYRQMQQLSGGITIRLGRIDPCEALADADHLRQLLVILVENAIKYNREEGEVRIELRRDGVWMRVSVADTGLGIADEDLPHIFERFYRSKHARTEPGTGLGLSIAKWIAESHGGELRVESARGQGTTFTFSMHPAQVDAAPSRMEPVA